MSEMILDTAKVKQWRRYTDCVPTNEEWLGQIPRHWDATRIKYLCQVKRGASPRPIDDRAYFDDDGEYAWVRISDVTASEKYLLKTTERLSTLGQSKSVKLEPGRIFLSIAATVGKAIITKIKCCIHDGFVYFDRLKQNPEFWYYLFESNQLFVGLGKLGTQLNLNTETIGNIRIPVPPLAEQRAIAAFLDRETARIDVLIGHKERLIALLEEKRQAVISHAVTRGLNRNAEMQDSTVEWIGEIPKHWRIIRIANVATKITNGFVGPTRDILVSEGVRYLQSLHIKHGYVLFDRGPYYVTEEWSKSHAKSILRTGDVVIVQTGAEVGQSAVIKPDFDGVNCHALIIVSPKPGFCEGEFLGRVLRSDYGRQALRIIETGALHPHLNCTYVREVLVPLPPVAEQAAIANFLDKHDKRFDAVIANVRNGLKYYYEYRTALISAAVTGQIDVREEVNLDD